MPKINENIWLNVAISMKNAYESMLITEGITFMLCLV